MKKSNQTIKNKINKKKNENLIIKNSAEGTSKQDDNLLYLNYFLFNYLIASS